MAKVLVVSGSSRTGSYNKKLAALAAAAARAAGAAEVTEVDLRALALPIYDGDLEAQGQPAGALELRRLFASHDALIIASPEYNALITPLLLNALDWASRPPASDGLPSGTAAMNGTVVGLVSASPGNYGGMRGLITLRTLLSMNLGMMIVPTTLSVPKAHDAFDAAGAFVDAKQQQALEKVVAAVLHTADAMAKA